MEGKETKLFELDDMCLQTMVQCMLMVKMSFCEKDMKGFTLTKLFELNKSFVSLSQFSNIPTKATVYPLCLIYFHVPHFNIRDILISKIAINFSFPNLLIYKMNFFMRIFYFLRLQNFLKQEGIFQRQEIVLSNKYMEN